MRAIPEAFESSRREIASGYFETRRQMLWLPASVVASVFLGNEVGLGINQPPAAGGGTIEWEAFLQQCVPVAAELHRDSSAAGQEAYLYWIASMISRAAISSIPRAKAGRFGKLEPAVSFGVCYRGKPFFIVEWQLEPRAFLPPHCHPNASVCTLGLEGEAQIRNFEIVGQAPDFTSTGSFVVRETHSEIVSQGRINTLSSTRDNIHTFQAGKSGARGIDISTLHGPDVGFSFLEIAARPKEAGGRIFEAAWRAM